MRCLSGSAMVGLYRAVRSAGVGHADEHRPSLLGEMRYRGPRQIETVEVDLMAEFLQSHVLLYSCTTLPWACNSPPCTRLFVDRRTGVETGCNPMSPLMQDLIVTQTAGFIISCRSTRQCGRIKLLEPTH